MASWGKKFIPGSLLFQRPFPVWLKWENLPILANTSFFKAKREPAGLRAHSAGRDPARTPRRLVPQDVFLQFPLLVTSDADFPVMLVDILRKLHYLEVG